MGQRIWLLQANFRSCLGQEPRAEHESEKVRVKDAFIMKEAQVVMQKRVSGGAEPQSISKHRGSGYLEEM